MGAAGGWGRGEEGPASAAPVRARGAAGGPRAGPDGPRAAGARPAVSSSTRSDCGPVRGSGVPAGLGAAAALGAVAPAGWRAAGMSGMSAFGAETGSGAGAGAGAEAAGFGIGAEVAGAVPAAGGVAGWSIDMG